MPQAEYSQRITFKDPQIIQRGNIDPEMLEEPVEPEPFPAADLSGGGRSKTGLDYYRGGRRGDGEGEGQTPSEEDFDPLRYSQRLRDLWTTEVPEGLSPRATRLFNQRDNLPYLSTGTLHPWYKNQREELTTLLKPIRSTDCTKEFLTFIHDLSLARAGFSPDRILSIYALKIADPEDLGPYGPNTQEWEEELLHRFEIELSRQDSKLEHYLKSDPSYYRKVLSFFFDRWNQQIIDRYH